MCVCWGACAGIPCAEMALTGVEGGAGMLHRLLLFVSVAL